MIIEKTIPFQWVGWDQHDVLFMAFYDVEFVEDFGIFKKGEKFDSISVNYGEGWIEAYDSTQIEPVKKQNYVAKPIE